MSKNINTLADRIHWMTQCKQLAQHWSTYQPEYNNVDSSGAMNIYRFIEALNRAMNYKVIVVTDAGSPSYALPQNLKCQPGQRFVFSSAQADMGCSVPAAVGVSMSALDHRTVVVTGDGSFNSNIQELATIRQHRLPVTIFVLNNSGYLSIKNTQQRFFENRVYGVNADTGIWFPDLEQIARSYEFDYAAISSIDSVDQKVSAAIQHIGPIIIEVMLMADQEIIPTQMFKQVNGRRVQAALDDMYPFLPDKELEEWRTKLRSPAPWEAW